MPDLTIHIRRIREKLRRYRLNFWLLEGRERHSGEELLTLYAGHELNKNYLLHIIYAGRCEQRFLGKVWTWSLAQLVKGYPAFGLVVAETEEGYFNRLGGAEDFYIPCWIDGEVDIKGGAQTLKTNESLRDDLRKVRKYGLQYEITKDVDKLGHFYHDMYSPHVIRMHGDRAALMSYEGMINRIDNLELMLIRCGGEYIAGEIFLYQADGVRSWSLGVKDGNPIYVKQGAISALYYYRRIYLAGKGFDKYHAGATRPFLDDGVLQYKKKWGLKLTCPRPGGWWLRYRPQSSAGRAFMQKNPFVFRKDGALYGLLSGPSGNSIYRDEPASIPEKYDIPGLQGFKIVK